MTYEELAQRYNQLVEEENSLPAKMNEILKTVESLRTKASDLERKAQEEDLKISEKPAQVYKKVCGSAFLGIGKSCQEVPVPNPEVAREINIRNEYIRQRNSIINQIEANLKKINEFTKKQIEIETEQVAIREQMVNLQQKVLQEPFNILETLGKAIKSLFIKEQFHQSLEGAEKEELKEKIIPVLPYLAVGLGILLLFLPKKEKERIEIVKGKEAKGKLHIRVKEAR